MPRLVYLVDEIGSGMEIYYSSRLSGRYLKTAFILCDDYVELISKLWLVENVNGWMDKKGNGSFKSFQQILNDVKDSKNGHCHPSEHQRIVELTHRIKERRTRRNEFFHSTHLLDLSVNKRRCVEAFCDLIEFGELLFGNDWCREIETNTKTDILCVLFQLEKMAFVDTTIEPRINELLGAWPRREKERAVSKKGTQYAKHPEDMHLRLCLDWGGREFRDAIKSLLSQCQWPDGNE